MEDYVAYFKSQLNKIIDKNLFRSLENRRSPHWPNMVIDGAQFVNFSGNDYLGMSNNPNVLNKVKGELSNYGVGAGGAALLSGRAQIHDDLEKELALFTGFEDALLFSSGYLANLGSIPAITKRDWLIAHDRLNHASLIDAVQASNCKHYRYPHLSHNPVSVIPNSKQSKPCLVVTDSVFSMDGDVIDANILYKNCMEKNYFLYIDDAHGFGVINKGSGISRDIDSADKKNVSVMITLGKSLGAAGALILGTRELIEYLRQVSRTFIYDTALPPIIAAAALEALRLLKSDSSYIDKLNFNIDHFLSECKNYNIPVKQSKTPIQPIVIGNSHKTLELALNLQKKGFFVKAIRPPTVPKGTSRIRLTLSSVHSKEQITSVISEISKLLRT